MKNRTVKGLIAVCAAVSMLLTGCGELTKTAITVGNEKISAGTIKFVAEYGSSTTDITKIADNVKRNYLINEIGEKMGLTLSDEEKEEVSENVISYRQRLGGKKATDEILKKYKIGDDVLETLMATSTYAEKIFDEIEVAEPTDDEIKEAFKTDYLRAKHILIEVDDSEDATPSPDGADPETTANELLKRAQSGEDFDTLIKEYNEDPGMESNADGYFFTDGDMVQEFEDAVKSIQPGEFTICKSDYGYHIIQRLPIDESDAKFSEYLEDNRSAISSSLNSKKQIEALDAKAEELGITVTTNEDVINSIVIEEPEEEE